MMTEEPVLLRNLKYLAVQVRTRPTSGSRFSGHEQCLLTLYFGRSWLKCGVLSLADATERCLGTAVNNETIF